MLTAAMVALIALNTASTAVEPGVAWYGDWDAARAEARRSQRPILLHFARPACQGISGVF